MELKDIRAAYFIGAGGIGMSAIARYFISRGTVVAGYDRTRSELCRQLECEGMLLHYEESIDEIPHACRDPKSCLVVYTPAVPSDHKELEWFRQQGYEIEKRAQVLGTITRSSRALCVAGTHGKTTTSAMAAHILHQSRIDCTAFLGGITKNYQTNYIIGEGDYVVIEADEYDRSFHQLEPHMSVITSTDPDHLDIYGTEEAYLDGFAVYTSLIRSGGTLIVHEGLKLKPRLKESVRLYTYGREGGQFHASNIRMKDGELIFDFAYPDGVIADVMLGQPIPINVENAVGAMAMAMLAGCNAEELKYGIRTYKGVDRRFDFKIKTHRLVFLSDYAHHPREVEESMKSIRALYEGRRLTAMFQPHLYSRTRDFYREFASSLSLADDVVLVDLYPAREEPIPGVSSKLILDCLRPGISKTLIPLAGVMDYVGSHDFDVLIVLGAGDLDDKTPEIEAMLKERIRKEGGEE